MFRLWLLDLINRSDYADDYTWMILNMVRKPKWTWVYRWHLEQPKPKLRRRK